MIRCEANMYKLIEKNIEWLVALAVVLITTFKLFRSLMVAYELSFINYYVRYLIIFILLLVSVFQSKHDGFKVHDRLFGTFYFVYCIYILLDITLLRRYPLENMLSVPRSVLDYSYELIVSVGYLLCAKTIYIYFNVKKYVLLSLIVCTIPSVLFIQTVGVDLIQSGIGRDDEEYISTLTITYANVPLLVLAVMNFNTLFKNKRLSVIISLTIIASVVYVLFAYGKRGPMLWSLVNIAICFYMITKKSINYIIIAAIFIAILYANIDSIIDGISQVLPRTGERIELALKEGDTNGRIDMEDTKHSTYLIGLENFSRSPVWGYYFRLVTVDNLYKGAYAHNVFIEILMTMGLLGFIPFMVLIKKALKKTYIRFKKSYTKNQLAFLVLFLCSFLQLQTTGTCVFDHEFWLFLYILCCMDIFSSKKILIRMQ